MVPRGSRICWELDDAMLVEHKKNFVNHEPVGEWFTNSSSVLPTSQVVYQLINHRKLVVYCFYIIIQKTRDFSVSLPAQ